MVRTVDGTESSHFVVVCNANPSLGRYGEILVATQVVVAGIERPLVVELIARLQAGHPCADGYSVFFLSHLVVEGCLGSQVLGMKVDVGTQKLLLVGAGVLVEVAVLQSHVHEHGRYAERKAWHVVVIPQRLHCLVGL